MSRVFANGPGDQGSIPGWIKWSNPGNGVVASEKGAFGSPLTKVTNFTFI